MAFTLIVKNSSQAGKIPTASQIGRGELALNLVDQKLYSKNTSDEVFEIAPPGEVPSGGTDDRPDGPSIGDLYYDIDLGDLLVWNGAEWVPVGQEAIALNDLTDVDTTSGLADGTVLGYDGSVWKPVSPASLAVDVDLGYTPDGDNAGTVTNTAGDDATIPIATDTVAGLFTGAEKQKLAGIDEGAKNFTAGRALTFDSDTLNADIATDAALGVVSIGDGIDVTPEGEISVTIDVPPGTIISETAPDPAESGQLWWADTDVDEGGGRLYIYTGDEWVDTSLPGAGSYLTTEQADDLYLSKTVDDVAQGEIEFQKGLTITGGDDTITSGMYREDNGNIRIKANRTLAATFSGEAEDVKLNALSLSGTFNEKTTEASGFRGNVNTNATTGTVNQFYTRFTPNNEGPIYRGFVCHSDIGSKNNATAFFTNMAEGDGTNYGVYCGGSATSYFAGDVIQGNDDNDGIYAGTVAGVIIRNGSQSISRPASGGASASFMNFIADSTTGRIKRTNAGTVVTENISVTTRASRTATVPADLLDGSSVIKLLTPSTEGFAAQDLINNVPSAVIEDEPENDEVSIDQTKLIPILTKALQETIAKNEELEEKLAVAEDLAARVATLEQAVISSLS